jgi:hypothetical protein
MAGVSLIFEQQLGKIDSVEFDATLSELHSGEAKITEHPVEAGANVTDHIRPQPVSVQLDGVITNSPLQQGEYQLTIPPITPLQPQRVRASTTLIRGIEGPPHRAEAAYEALEQLRLSGTRCKVVTSLREYDSMVITSIECPRDAQIGDAVRVRVTLVRIETAESRTVEARDRKQSKPPEAKAKTDTGKKGTTAATKAENKSAAKSWLDGVFK